MGGGPVCITFRLPNERLAEFRNPFRAGIPFFMGGVAWLIASPENGTSSVLGYRIPTYSEGTPGFRGPAALWCTFERLSSRKRYPPTFRRSILKYPIGRVLLQLGVAGENAIFRCFFACGLLGQGELGR